MKAIQSILVAVLSGDQAVADLTISQWDLLIRQARKSMLLAKLYYFIDKEFDLANIPESALRLLQSSRVHSTKQYTDLLWEVKHLEKVAKQQGYPLVLLKGSAYAMAGLTAAKGRIFSDIDLMVNKNNINHTEKQLMINGWVSSNTDAYEELYYRKWMHEIPPVHHLNRGSTLDLHHNILPLTAKNSPDAALLLAQSRALPEYDFISVLSPLDMIIHSATHLFYDGELEHGLRDLVDLDALICSNQISRKKSTSICIGQILARTGCGLSLRCLRRIQSITPRTIHVIKITIITCSQYLVIIRLLNGIYRNRI